MSNLEDRQEAFEAKFKHDEELKFKIQVRASKLFGLWAADQMGIDGQEADAYAKQVVEADFDEPGFEDVLRKVAADFDDKGLDISDHRMRVEMEKCLAKAQDQIMNQAT